MIKNKKLYILLLALFFNYNLYSQSCSSDNITGNQNWSQLTFNCVDGGIEPIVEDGVYVENVIINGLGNGESVTFDIDVTITGNVEFNTTNGSNPLIYVQAGDSVIINGDFLNYNNNVTYIIDGFLQINGKIEGKNNNLFGGSGVITGDSLILDNNASCYTGSCPTIIFNTCLSNNDFCKNNNNPFLPTSILEFNVKSFTKENILTWKVNKHFNDNSIFYVEKSLDGYNFEIIDLIYSKKDTDTYIYHDYYKNNLCYYKISEYNVDYDEYYSTNIIKINTNYTNINYKYYDLLGREIYQKDIFYNNVIIQKGTDFSIKKIYLYK